MVSFMEVAGARPVALITARAEVEQMGRKALKDNVFTCSWNMPLSFNPALYAISVGKQRFSYRLIKSSQVFAVNFIPAALKKAAVYCGTQSGEFIDKFKEAKLKTEEAEKIECFRLKEAVAFLECEVVNEIEAGDHVLFVGRVVNSNINADKKRLYHITGDKFEVI
jgi:flavin reductase (DIM6/NTAB) family NADH-FMN oxidoreductase RutF